MLLFGVSSDLRGQATATAALQGTVVDKSQAVVPGADVKITNKETGLARTTTTTDAGLYRFDLLPSGAYDVRVTAKGFAVQIFDGVQLGVAQTRTLDAMLSPSQISEVITVESGGAPLVDVTKTDVSLPVTQQMVQDLP